MKDKRVRIQNRQHYRKEGARSWVPKTPYATEEEAQEIVRRNGRGSAYQCRTCRQWHVGGANPLPVEGEA